MPITSAYSGASRDQKEPLVEALRVMKMCVENLLELLEPSEAGTSPRNGSCTSLPTIRHRGRPLVDPEFRVGERIEGEVIAVEPERGFVRFKIFGRVFTPLLHYTNMTKELQDDLSRGDIEHEELICLEVIEVDSTHNRVLVRDLPDPVEEG